MPVVNPGIRRFLGSAIQRLFNSASFAAPLTHSAVPERASSGTTATFTRATTKTWPNNDGYLVTGVSGEIGFVGARRVDNLIRLGAAQSSTLAVAANVTMTLPAGAYQFSMGAGTGRVTFSGTGGATGTLDAVTTGRVHVAKTITAGTLIVTASVATLVDIQVVSMVAETDQTTIREYVSVGVASSPYYHGSMVDGVKCFATDINGAAIPSTTLLGYLAEGSRTNLCLQSNAFTTAPWANQVGTVGVAQDIVGPDGAVSAWTFTDNDGAVAEIYGANVGALTAASYTFSIFVAKTTGAQSSYPVVLMYDGTATRIAAATVDTSNGIATIWTSYTGWTAVGSATCVSFNDDFWRVSITFTASTNVWVVNFLPAGALTATLAGPAFDASATGSAVFYGAQVELGSSASSYIPTTTAAVTRNADVLTYSSAGNAVVTAGWIYCDAMVPTNNAAPQIQIDDGSNNNRVMFDDGGSSNGGTRFVVQSGGVIQANFTNFSSSANSVQKRCVTWATNYAQSAQGGSLGTGDTSVTVPVSFTQIGVGGANGSAVVPCNIKNLCIGQRQLSASEQGAIVA